MAFFHYKSFLISESQLSSSSVKGFYPCSDKAFSLFFPIFFQSISYKSLLVVILLRNIKYQHTIAVSKLIESTISNIAVRTIRITIQDKLNQPGGN